MGLDIVVGYLAELCDAGEEEAVRQWRDIFASVNVALATAGVDPHREPEDLGGHAGMSWDMWGYSGLHYLRRIAAYLVAGRALPPPGDKKAADDPVLLEAYHSGPLGPAPKSGLGMPRVSPPRFDHLIQHSDCEGIYLPLDFEEVIYPVLPDDAVAIPGGELGSVFALQRECERLAAVLQIPPDLPSESDEVGDAADNQGTGSGWKRYGVESLTCLKLLEACRASLKIGAAIVFA